MTLTTNRRDKHTCNNLSSTNQNVCYVTVKYYYFHYCKYSGIVSIGEGIKMDTSLLLFQTSSSIQIIGASRSGKTEITLKILKAANGMFTEPYEKIIYCYGIIQPKLERLEIEMSGLILHKGVPSESILAHLDTSKHNIICMDDVAEEVVASKDICKLITMGCYHAKLTVIFLTHNAFENGSENRTLNLNMNYILLFKNVRDEKQVRQ